MSSLNINEKEYFFDFDNITIKIIASNIEYATLMVLAKRKRQGKGNSITKIKDNFGNEYSYTPMIVKRKK